MESTHAVHRFTVDEYERLVEAGALTEDDRVELVRGLIIDVAAIGSRHAGVVKRLRRLLDRALGDRVILGVQDPVRLPPDSEPEPDVSVLVPRPDDYTTSHPAPGEILLCIEVADTTLVSDRDKIKLYAEHGIPESWLVDLREDRIEIHREPAVGGYRSVEGHGRGDRVSPLSFPDVSFVVEQILGA